MVVWFVSLCFLLFCVERCYVGCGCGCCGSYWWGVVCWCCMVGMMTWGHSYPAAGSVCAACFGLVREFCGEIFLGTRASSPPPFFFLGGGLLVVLCCLGAG